MTGWHRQWNECDSSHLTCSLRALIPVAVVFVWPWREDYWFPLRIAPWVYWSPSLFRATLSRKKTTVMPSVPTASGHLVWLFLFFLVSYLPVTTATLSVAFCRYSWKEKYFGYMLLLLEQTHSYDNHTTTNWTRVDFEEQRWANEKQPSSGSVDYWRWEELKQISVSTWTSSKM